MCKGRKKQKEKKWTRIALSLWLPAVRLCTKKAYAKKTLKFQQKLHVYVLSCCKSRISGWSSLILQVSDGPEWFGV